MAEAKETSKRGQDRLAKELAMQLYLQGEYTQQEIADRVGKRRQTIIRWINDGKWEKLRVGVTMTKEEQLANLYRQLADMNNAIAEREQGKRFASPPEADTIAKLTTSIKKLEGDIGLSDIIAVGRKFITFLRSSVEHSKLLEISSYFDAFMRGQIR